MAYNFLRFPNFRDKALTLSYDDGSESDVRFLEILNAYNVKCTFNLNSGLFSEDGKGRITEEQARTLYTPYGHEIAAHGFKHLPLSDVDVTVGVNDVLSDVKKLEGIFGTRIIGMAYANGRFDDRAVETLKTCGIKYCRTTKTTEDFSIPADWLRLPATRHHGNPRLMELAGKFLENPEIKYYWSRKPKIFYLWGHSYEFDRNNNWEVIENFCKFVSGREDVWYATNGEIYRYVEAYDRLEFSVNGEFVFNPTATDVFIEYFGRRYVLPAGKTTKISE